MSAPALLRFVVDVELDGSRLDAALAQTFSEISRSRWRRRIEEQTVHVDGMPATAKQKLSLGQEVTAEPVAPKEAAAAAEDIPLDIVFEDEHLLVVNKQAGLVVHPAPGHRSGTLVNALLFHVPGLSVGDEERPGIVHRLDKDTSGLLLVAKTDAAHAGLTALFQKRTIQKRYRAYCLGKFNAEEFLLDTGHARHRHDRRRFSTKMPPPTDEDVRPGQKLTVRRARAVYTAGPSDCGVTELTVALETGRTHQIRAQLADIGRPLVCDGLYGGEVSKKRVGPGKVFKAAAAMTRHALHAETLAFQHPLTGEDMTFTAPLPDDLVALAAALSESESQGKPSP